jgi:hypothetical protein
MYELQFVWRHSALIITSLIARWQSISSSPQAVDISGEAIRLRLAVGLLHVLYIECTKMLVFNSMLTLLLTSRDFSSIYLGFLMFQSLHSVQNHTSDMTLHDTVFSVPMPRATNARTRGSFHCKCQCFISCPASADRLISFPASIGRLISCPVSAGRLPKPVLGFSNFA